MPVLFCKDAAEFREWLRRNHRTVREQWVGYYKVATGKPSVTWPESVDVALCFGWIDGHRKTIDDRSYRIRFTPRQPGSIWSARNLARMRELIDAGLVEPSVRAAFESGDPKQGAPIARKPPVTTLPPKYQRQLKAVPEAWTYFSNAAPSYRRNCAHWVMSAKQEETRQRRLATLIECCERSEVIPPLRWAPRR